MRPPTIVAYGGGGFSMESGNPLLDDYVFALAGRRRPRVCFLPTASGDADHYITRFYRHFAATAECSHLSLFRRERGVAPVDPLAQDVIYVGGGCVKSMLGAWRAHGIDDCLREAWQRGVVLAGLSAGSLCWFTEAVTAFHGPPERVDGLGLLPWSNCVHYDGEPERRVEYQALVAEGMTPGYGVQDGAAIRFEGIELAEAVASRPQARAFRVDPTGETELPTRFLGAPVLVPEVAAEAA